MALVNELPPDWNSYNPAQKIAWFNAMEVAIDDLQNAGVDGASINWMLNNGYRPPPERDYEAERIAAEQEAARIAAEQEAIRQENIRQQEIRRQQEEQARIDEYYQQEAIREAERIAAEQEAARQEAIRQEQIRAQQLAAQQEAARQEAARIAAEQQAARNKAASVGVNLPSNWFDIGAQDRVNWLVDNKVTESQLRAYGTSQAEIDAIKPYGYYDVPAKLAADQEAERVAEAARQEAARQEAARVEAARVAAERTAAENEVKSLYQEVLGRQPTAAELSQYVSQFGTSIDATEKNTFSKDVSTEVLKNKLLAGNPDGDELTRRVVIESVNNKWTPQQTLDFVNTQFGVNKTIADYEKAVSDFFAPAVSNLLANGKTEADIRQLGADQGIIPSVIDAAVRNNIGRISQNDILSKTSNLIGTKTENNQTFQTLDVPGLIKFADDNKLSYADVASALATKFPTLKTSDLVFEKDRQQISALAKDTADPKDATKTIKSVSYADALKEAITKGIGLENLARFFGQTPDQFKTTISSNLGSFADSLRASGVNAEAGLSDLLGIQPKDTTAALQTVDTDKAITGALKQKETGGLTYNEILDEVEASGMTIDDFVTRYFGQDKTDLLTGLKSEAKFTPEQRDLRDDFNAFTSTFNKDNPLTYSKISDYLADKKLTDAQAVNLFGVKADELAGYRTDTKIAGQLDAEKKDDGRLSLNEILDVIDGSGMDINTFVERYYGSDPDDLKLASNLTNEKKFTPEQRNLRDAYAVFTSKFDEDNPLTDKDIAGFVDQNKLTDAQAESILGVPAKGLSDYRRNTFITSGLNELEKSDNRLDYTEIVTFAKDNNIPFNEVAKYLAAPEKQESLVRTLEETQTDMGRSPAERLEFQLNQLTNSGKQSGTWDRNEGWEHHADKMTNYLTGLGITDLRNIATKVENRDTQVGEDFISGDTGYTEYKTVSLPYVIYYDKTSGKELQAVDQRYNNGAWEFGSEGSGKGSTGYILAPTSKDGEGGVGVTSQWREKYGVQEYAMPLAFVAAVVAPYLLPELIGGVVGGVELAALGGEMVAGTGLTGSLISAGIPATVAPYAAQIIVNGVYNGTLSEATGGEFTKGFIAGGVAPVLGQVASNAVNSALSDLNLPAGVDKAVGNAVTQLIAKGEIDPLQMITAGVSPTVSKALQDATGLNSAQTKLILDTVLSQGKNLQALMNPQTALTFVMNNKGVFDGLGLDAASGTKNIQTGQAVDLGAFNEDQVKQLQGQDTVTATGMDTVLGAGQDTISPVLVDTVAGVTGLDTAPSITTPSVIDEFRGYDSAIKAAEAIASGATQFEGVEAAQRFNEARAAGALDFQNYDLAKLEASLIGNQKTFANAFAAARELYGPNATFNYDGKLYSTATFQERPDLGITQVAGSGRGEAAGKTAEQEALLIQTAKDLTQAQQNEPSTGILGWIKDTMKQSSDAALAYLKTHPNDPNVKAVSEAAEASGELLKNVIGGTALQLNNKPLASAFIKGGEELINLGQAIGSGPEDTKNFKETLDLMRAQPKAEDKLAVMFGRMLDGTSGFSRQTFLEMRQEIPALFSGGLGVRTAMLVSGLIDTTDTAGNAAITEYDKATQQGKSHEEALSAARTAGMAAGGTEALLQLTLGKLGDFAAGKLDNVFSKVGVRTGGEYLTEGAQEGFANAAVDYAIRGAVDLNEAITLGLIGGQIGSHLTGATSPLTISEDLANRPGVVTKAEVISVDQANNLAVVKTPTGTDIIDTTNLGPVSPGESVSVTLPAGPVDVGAPDVKLTDIDVKGTKSNLVTLSPSQYLPDEDRVIALVDLGNGTTQPFYISTGLGGKIETEPGKWYPFFGIGQDGWFNKTTGKDQANYYNSALLRDIAQTLDQTIGDVRSQSRTYPIIKKDDTVSIANINKDMRPMSYTDAGDNIQSFYNNVATTLVRIDNSAAGLEAGLVKAIQDGTITNVGQIQTNLDRMNVSPELKQTLLQVGSETLGVSPTTGVTSTTQISTTPGPAVTAGTETAVTGSTANATNAATAATNAANQANANAQVATDTANALAATGAVNTAVNTAVENANAAASQATQNATTATQAAAVGDTKTAEQANVVANQNANVTTQTNTELSNVFKPKEELEEPKPPVTIPGTPAATIPGTIGTDTIGTSPDTIATGPDTIPGGVSSTGTTGSTTGTVKPSFAFPSIFFPISQQPQQQFVDYGYPTVPPPELSGTYEMPYPNYLRPLDPYLGYGLGTLMGDLNAQEQRNGGDQPLQNAQAQAAPAPR